MALAETAELAIRINLEGNAATGVKKLNGQLDGLKQNAGRVGKGVGQIGAGFARAGLFVGGAVVTGLGAAAKAAIDFDDAFAGVRKTVDEADLAEAGLSFEKLETTFRDMATRIPIAATEFARLGETAGALGVAAGDIDDFVETTALLGVTTDLTADQAADALGRIGTILNFTGEDYEDFADSLVALGNAGASTESEIIEISKRFAAEAKAAGLATDDIAGLASATASLGFAPERGGTALARVFANMGTNISLANEKGKAFSKLVGKPIEELQKSIDRGEGLPLFLDVLQEIKGLSPTDANRTLKALGVTNTSDRTIFRAMADQLPFVNEQLEIAADASGALSEEATKRFDTVASKITLLKNNLVEAGITIGEGFAPAIGRAAEKLSEFLRQDANKSALKSIGEDIGKAIDGIDWDAALSFARDFVDVMKIALDFSLRIAKAVNSLPSEIKGAAAALIVANKLSGGLIGAGVGNVVGGLAGAAATGLAGKAPGIGKLFAQPVFVTNWPIGMGLGGGGAAGAAGGAGLAGKLTKGLSVLGGIGITLAALTTVLEVQQGVSGASSAQAQGVQETATVFLGQNPTTQELQTALAGVDQGIHDLQSNPLYAIVQGDALTRLQEIKAELNTKLAATALEVQRRGERTVQSVDQSKQVIAQKQQETARETARGATQTQATTRASSASNAAVIAATQVTTAGAIINAIYAARPVISVTNVTRTYNRTTNYGPTSSSKNKNAADSNYGPN